MFEYFILGIIQGLSEFLPISSSGHLSLFQEFFKMEQSFLFVVAAHFGTFFSIVVFYHKNLLYIFKNILKPFSKNLFLKISLGCFPVVLVGYLFYDIIKASFSTLEIVACGFGLTGLFLIRTYWMKASLKKDPMKHLSELNVISLKQALLIGCFQVIALFPGFSRAGITTASGIWMGIRPSLSLHFSFLMGGFVLFAASAYELLMKADVSIFSSWAFKITFVSSFVFGYIALTAMKAWVFKLHKIGIYLIILSTSLILYCLLKKF